MEQLNLALLSRLDKPSAAPSQYVAMCKSYRQAVCLSWALRRIKNMTHATLALLADMKPQHVSDYFAKDDKPGRRDLPAKAISRYEAVVGNTLVSQWLAHDCTLTVLEEMQATRAAA